MCRAVLAHNMPIITLFLTELYVFVIDSLCGSVGHGFAVVHFGGLSGQLYRVPIMIPTYSNTSDVSGTSQICAGTVTGSCLYICSSGSNTSDNNDDDDDYYDDEDDDDDDDDLDGDHGSIT